jgi:alkanesulfonate monooxygenase SsuD/methylene tetrahydromethanopterin reductase-like flavin-dependent oxidoreductase (luciferase family)
VSGLRYAVGLPTVGVFGDPAVLVELAVAAQAAGWDAVFLWDHLLYHDPDWPVANPTVTAAAIAARTGRIRLGVLMCALPRRRVQVVAREVASLDVLSAGRVVFGAGLGSMDDEYAAFGEDPDLGARAAALDAGLADLARLWSGAPGADAAHPGAAATPAGVVRRALAEPGRLPPGRALGRQHADLHRVRARPTGAGGQVRRRGRLPGGAARRAVRLRRGVGGVVRRTG